MDRGLLGAVAGLGQGLVKVGQDLAERRERALQWAREEATRQEARRTRQVERTEDRDFATARALWSDRQRRDAAEDTRTYTDERDARQFERQQTRDRERFRHQDADREDRQAEARALTTLRADLAQRNSRAAAAYARQLSAPDVVGVIYDDERSNPDGSVTSMAYGRRRDGSTFPMGRITQRSTRSSNSGNSSSPDL